MELPLNIPVEFIYVLLGIAIFVLGVYARGKWNGISSKSYLLTFLGIMAAFYFGYFARQDAATDRVLVQQQQKISHLLKFKEESGDAVVWFSQLDVDKLNGIEEVEQMLNQSRDIYSSLSRNFEVQQNLFDNSLRDDLLKQLAKIEVAREDLEQFDLEEPSELREATKRVYDLHGYEAIFVYYLDRAIKTEIERTQENIALLTTE